jgi:hypothetical protein
MQSAARGIPAPRHPISFASFRRRIFCKPCNTHFKHLEDEVIPILVPLARGRILSFDDDTRLLLALWAAKTGMALLAAHGLGHLLPQGHRDAVRYHAEPPADSWVGYYPWAGRGPRLFSAENELPLSPPDPPHRLQTYDSIFSFGKIGFMFHGFTEPLPDGWRIGGPPGGPVIFVGRAPMVQFWPIWPGMLHWPPTGKHATAADVAHFARFSAVERVS